MRPLGGDAYFATPNIVFGGARTFVFRTALNVIPCSPSSDSTNMDREAFDRDRDGRNQASVGSTGSATMSVAAGGGSAGSGGFQSRRESSGRARTGTGHSDAAIGGVQQAAIKSRVLAAEFNPFKKQDEKEVRRAIRCWGRTLRAAVSCRGGKMESWVDGGG